jgi:hypothetical protein
MAPSSSSLLNAATPFIGVSFIWLAMENKWSLLSNDK